MAAIGVGKLSVLLGSLRWLGSLPSGRREITLFGDVSCCRPSIEIGLSGDDSFAEFEFGLDICRLWI